MSSYDMSGDLPQRNKAKVIKSAFESESFESDGTIHVDGLVGSATISPSGRDIALASPEGLAIVDLDSPFNPPRRLRSYGQPWLVTDVQWSPFAARDYWVVSTANHRALVWNLSLREDSNTGAIEHSLQGHSRAITDINFSAHHPDILATCSVDGFVHYWDLRRPRQPTLTFCDWFAGATQVKFNRLDHHILASSHDRWLHIWDERRPSEPLKSISAHTSKIYGVDWNRHSPTGIATCSLDKTIKVWDYASQENKPDHIIRTDFPVWRARHTPFGSAILAMPQNEPGDLYLYDAQAPTQTPVGTVTEPVEVFPGHGDHKAKEFLWRSRGGIMEDGTDQREFQLVSWGTDNELRLQCMDINVLASVGYRKGGPAPKNLVLTRTGATYKTFRTVDDRLNRDRKMGTMSDLRASAGGVVNRQSALTMGMNSGPHGRHSRVGWRGPSMKAKVTMKRDRTQSQIGWLKGITITKRTNSSGLPKRQMSKDSSVFGHGYPDDGWGEPDTVQDELLRISTQIPKVKWENIDFDSLTLNASLNGPWGAGGETIFIKVKIDLPENYPTLAAPNFTIEKTSFLPEETRQRLTREIHQLADRFLHRKQNCLEVAFTYLLGEIDLESSTTLFKNVQDLEDGIDGLVGESSSSEEDEDIPAGGSATMSQELVPPAENDSALAPTSRPVVPPPARTCGARFSLDGRLVCFFLTKEEKARALLSSTVEGQKERPKGEPFFAGFGRLTFESHQRHRQAPDETSGADDQSDSDDSMESSSSSSSDSESMIHKMSLWYRPNRQLRKTWSEDRSIRSSGGGTGTGIGTGTGTITSRRRQGRPRSLTVIHDFRWALPSKRELAREYAIFGDGGDVCEHNATIAAKYGYDDVADVWHYLVLLLRKGIPLEVLDHHDTRRSSILVIARNVVSRYGKDHDTSCAQCDDAAQGLSLSGRVKWGEHPLARHFIAEVFDHYEKTADIQMLAMLTCIFSESTADDPAAYAESQLPQTETPLPLKAPSFSLDYFPTDASAWNLFGKKAGASAVTTPRTPLTPYYEGSQGSEEVIWDDAEPASNSYSCGETPPQRSKGQWVGVEVPTSSSRSPPSRTHTKGNTSLSSSFTATLNRSFTGGSSASPPAQEKKRPSPAETILHSLAPSMVTPWSTAPPTPGDMSVGRSSLSDDESRLEETLNLIPVPVSVSVYVEDQTIFDDDGWHSAPLLEPGKSHLYSHYRYAYAEMLQMWNEPLARLEIMKFNIIQDDRHAGGGGAGGGGGTVSAATGGGLGAGHDFHDSSNGAGYPRPGSSPIILGKKDLLQSLLASGRGLDVTGVCRIHETQLEPLRYTTRSKAHVGGAQGVCERCHRMQSQLRCVYCLEPVDALFPPCLSCGCASHEDCLAEWHAAGETTCPAGDECNCVEEAANGQVESWAALRGAMQRSQNILAMLPSSAIEDDSDDLEEKEEIHKQQQQQQQKVHQRKKTELTEIRIQKEEEAVEEDNGRGRQTSAPPDVPTTPSSAAASLAPSSAANIAFGRFRRSAGSWSRASSLRREARREG